jgi:hypothetical protein
MRSRGVRGRLEGALALQILRSRELIFVLVGLGILLRVAQYLANRSLWIDEAWIALNLIERPLSDLTKPLDFTQGAPVGFLLLEGVAGKIIGYSEYALRFFPLVCGLVSIPVFAWLARRILSQAAAPFAVLLFVVADGLTYYSSDVKPYETDVAVAVFLLAAGTILAEDVAGRSGTAIAVAVVGVALVPLSFPAVFMVAAVGGVLAVRLVFNRRLSLSSPAALAVLLWGSAALAVAVFSETTTRYTRKSFEASNAGSYLGFGLHALNVLGTGIAGGLGFPQQRPFHHIEKLALFCMLVGVVSLLRRNRTQLAMLVTPFALVLAASAAHVYPIAQRTDLFLFPLVILLVVEGVARIVRFAPAPAQPAVALVLAVALAAGPVSLAGTRLVHPRTTEEIRPVLEFVRDHWRPGDVLYVHYNAQYAFLYYDICKCLRLSLPRSGRDLWPLEPLRGQRTTHGPAAIALAPDVVLGRYHGGNSHLYIEELDRLRTHRRVWFLYSHVSSESERSLVKGALLPHMASLGNRINGIDRTGAHAYLYELRPAGAP